VTAPAPRARAEIAFQKRYGARPEDVVFAPGRLNLIGEHVDHQGGSVLPLPLREGVAVAWGRRPDRAVRLLTVDPPSVDRFVIGEATRSGKRSADLVRGACAALEARGSRVPGLDLAVTADLPARKGLGSSGAFTVAALRAFLQAIGRTLEPKDVARIVMEVEERWAGVRCGPMDPYVAAAGKRGRPLLLDCRALSHEDLPWLEGVEAVPLDTGVERRLSETPYDERRAELERGLASIRKRDPASTASAEAFARVESDLPEPDRRRCRHFVTELERVRRAAAALRAGDAPALGRILDEGHESLSRDFECSTPEIDALAAAERAKPGVLGVRLQGAGFGGSLVVLRTKQDDG
jgi:galactokinase